MQTTLKKWTNPASGQVRVYVNDARLWRGVKLFFFCEEIGEIKAANYRIVGATGQSREEADEVANEVGDRCRGDWTTLVSLAAE